MNEEAYRLFKAGDDDLAKRLRLRPPPLIPRTPTSISVRRKASSRWHRPFCISPSLTESNAACRVYCRPRFGREGWFARSVTPSVQRVKKMNEGSKRWILFWITGSYENYFYCARFISAGLRCGTIRNTVKMIQRTSIWRLSIAGFLWMWGVFIR